MKKLFVFDLMVGVAVLSFGAQGEKKEFTSFAKIVAPQEADAFNKKNTAFFEKLYAPDFKTKNENGVTDGKKVAMFLLRYHFNSLQKLNYHVKILSLQAAGKVGTVKMMTVLDGVTQSRHGAKPSVIKVTRLEKQVFVKKGDQWLMSLDEDLQKPMVLMPPTPSMAATKIVPARSH